MFQLEHAPALSFGARLRVWLNAHFGLEAALAHTQSRVQAHEVASPSVFLQSEQSVGAQVTAYTVRAAWRSGPALSPVSFQLTAGLGALSRGGDAYARLEKTTDLAVVAGTGIRLRVSDLVALRRDLEDYVSTAELRRRAVIHNPGSQGNPTGPPTLVEIVDLDGGMQHDLIFSPSIVITILCS